MVKARERRARTRRGAAAAAAHGADDNDDDDERPEEEEEAAPSVRPKRRGSLRGAGRGSGGGGGGGRGPGARTRSRTPPPQPQAKKKGGRRRKKQQPDEESGHSDDNGDDGSNQGDEEEKQEEDEKEEEQTTPPATRRGGSRGRGRQATAKKAAAKKDKADDSKEEGESSSSDEDASEDEIPLTQLAKLKEQQQQQPAKKKKRGGGEDKGRARTTRELRSKDTPTADGAETPDSDISEKVDTARQQVKGKVDDNEASSKPSTRKGSPKSSDDEREATGADGAAAAEGKPDGGELESTPTKPPGVQKSVRESTGKIRTDEKDGGDSTSSDDDDAEGKKEGEDNTEAKDGEVEISAGDDDAEATKDKIRHAEDENESKEEKEKEVIVIEAKDGGVAGDDEYGPSDSETPNKSVEAPKTREGDNGTKITPASQESPVMNDNVSGHVEEDSSKVERDVPIVSTSLPSSPTQDDTTKGEGEEGMSSLSKDTETAQPSSLVDTTTDTAGAAATKEDDTSNTESYPRGGESTGDGDATFATKPASAKAAEDASPCEEMADSDSFTEKETKKGGAAEDRKALEGNNVVRKMEDKDSSRQTGIIGKEESSPGGKEAHELDARKNYVPKADAESKVTSGERAVGSENAEDGKKTIAINESRDADAVPLASVDGAGRKRDNQDSEGRGRGLEGEEWEDGGDLPERKRQRKDNGNEDQGNFIVGAPTSSATVTTVDGTPNGIHTKQGKEGNADSETSLPVLPLSLPDERNQEPPLEAQQTVASPYPESCSTQNGGTDVVEFTPGPCIDSIKMDLYLEGCSIHRGNGAERRFADYWDALGRSIGSGLRGKNRIRRSSTDEACNGIEVSLESFLTTKKLRRLHNDLILAIMRQSVQTCVTEEKFHRHIPVAWRGKLRRKFGAPSPKDVSPISSMSTRRVDENLEHKKLEKSQSIIEMQQEQDGRDRKRLKANFAYSSEVWSSCGQGQYDKPCSIVRGDGISTSFGGSRAEELGLDTGLPSATLPGALSIDPVVRSMIRREGMTLSESALWLLIVAVREHASSILRHAVSDSSGINDGNLPALKLGASPVSSQASSALGGATGSTPIGQDSTENSQQKNQRKRRLLSSYDVAQVLASNPRLGGGSMSASSSRLGSERCVLAVGGASPFAPPSGIGAIQSRINKEIEVASIKRRKRVHEIAIKSNVSPGAAIDGNISATVPTPAVTVPPPAVTAPTPPVQQHLSKQVTSPPLPSEGRPGREVVSVPTQSTIPERTIESNRTSTGHSTSAPSSTLPQPPVKSEAEAKPPSDNPTTIVVPKRGRGSGRKNLNAMRSRSFTRADTPSEKTEEESPKSSNVPADGETEESKSKSNAILGASSVPDSAGADKPTEDDDGEKKGDDAGSGGGSIGGKQLTMLRIAEDRRNTETAGGAGE